MRLLKIYQVLESFIVAALPNGHIKERHGIFYYVRRKQFLLAFSMRESRHKIYNCIAKPESCGDHTSYTTNKIPLFCSFWVLGWSLGTSCFVL